MPFLFLCKFYMFCKYQNYFLMINFLHIFIMFVISMVKNINHQILFIKYYLFTIVNYNNGYHYIKEKDEVDLPMIKPAILSSFILVFIEIIKELPLSSLLTPPNLKTLAFEMDRYASDEQLALSAAPAIVVVGISLALLVILNKLKDK